MTKSHFDMSFALVCLFTFVRRCRYMHGFREGLRLGNWAFECDFGTNACDARATACDLTGEECATLKTPDIISCEMPSP